MKMPVAGVLVIVRLTVPGARKSTALRHPPYSRYAYAAAVCDFTDSGYTLEIRHAAEPTPEPVTA